MPTIRFTPLQPTTFEQFRERVINSPRDALIEERLSAQNKTTLAIETFARQFGPLPTAPAVPGAPVTAGFLSQLIERMTYTPVHGESVGIGQAVGLLGEAVAAIGQTVVTGLSADGPLPKALSELKDCVCEPCHGEPASDEVSVAALKVLATLRPVHNILTDQVDASIATSNAELGRWLRTRPVADVRDWLQSVSKPDLAAIFWDQGRPLGISTDDAFDVVRRRRLAELLHLERLIAEQVVDPLPAAEDA